MNQRLQELYLDAAKHMEIVQQQGLPAPYQTRALAGKFAELIVRECLNEIESQRSNGENDDQWTITRDLCYHNMMAQLKQHFGVK